MNKPRKLYSENWNFTLYKVGDDFVISVVFFGRIDVFRSFKLDFAIDPADYSRLKEFAEHIRNNYDDFREIQIFPAIDS